MRDTKPSRRTFLKSIGTAAGISLLPSAGFSELQSAEGQTNDAPSEGNPDYTLRIVVMEMIRLGATSIGTVALCPAYSTAIPIP